MPNISGLYQGCQFRCVYGEVNGVPQYNEMANFMDLFLKAQSILWGNIWENYLISLFYFPKYFLTYDASTTPFLITNTEPILVTRTVNQPDNFQGYYPHNNKMFTFPYMYLSVDALTEEKSYKWEKSPITLQSGLKQFSVGFRGVLGLDPVVVATPDYEFIGNPCDEIIIPLGNVLPTYSNSVINLFGQNGIVWSIAKIGLSAILGMKNPNMALIGQSAVDTIQHSVSDTTTYADEISTRKIESDRETHTESTDLYAKERAENNIMMKAGQQLINEVGFQTHGARLRGNVGNYDIATGKFDVYFNCKGLKREYAERIDKYFDVYGYAVNQIKVPSLYNRPLWTYVKTKGCIVGGAIPDRYRVEICNIFDKGIRFWNVSMNLSCDIGNYNQDNSPLPSRNESNENEEESNG